MKKNNHGKISLLLMSALMAFSVNNVMAAQPITDPTVISSGMNETKNESVTNNPMKSYYSNTLGGALYHVNEGGTLNINSESSTRTYSGIASMIELTIKTPPTDGSLSIGDTFETGRVGGVIFNAGDLNIGTALDNATNTRFIGNLAGEGGAIANYGNAFIHRGHFENNEARAYSAGAGAAFDQSSDISIWNTATSGRGGAITNFDNLTLNTSQFLSNKAGNFGGAIYNGNGGNVTIDNNKFNENYAGNNGGAIYNSVTNSSTESAIINITNNTTFEGNSSSAAGGAIYSTSNHDRTNDSIGSYVTIDGSSFMFNTSKMGGAIYNNSLNYEIYETKLTITDTSFLNNGRNNDGTSLATTGGAIYNSGTFIGDDVTFNGNIADERGGALRNSGYADIRNSLFESNGGIDKVINAATGQTVTTDFGGAVYNTDGINIAADLNIDNTVFRNNSAGSGGAIYNDSNMVVSNSTFQNNTAVNYGGAIYNGGNATIIDSTFNTSNATVGGAIYGAADSNTTIIAQNMDMEFIPGLEPSTNTIHLETGSNSTNAAVLNLNAHAGRNINIDTKVGANIATEDAYVPVVNINYDSANYTGDVNFNTAHENLKFNVYEGTANFKQTISNSTVATQGYIENNPDGSAIIKGGTAKFHDDKFLGTNETKLAGHSLNNLVLNHGTLDIQQGVVSNIALNSFELKSDTNLKVDVDLANETMDNFDSANIASSVIDPNATLNITDMKNVDSNPNVNSATIFFTNLENLTVDKVSAPERLNGTIYQYAVQKKTGAQAGFGGDKSDDVYFHFNKVGASDNITPKPIAQLGAFLLFDNIYRQSFANMDMLSILTRDERDTLKRYNRYSNMFDDEINTFYQDKRQEDYPSVFVRGFTNLEHVRMDHGPKVSNVTYGTLIGHESGLYELGRGWDANYAVFGAYTGAHQTYNGIGVWQNGGSVGGVFTAYKGDFWAGLTANVGGWAVEAHNDFGHEHFPMLGTGVAMKTGYNIRMFDNKFILQPSYMMSYTFVYAYSHDNAAGVHIKQDPLHAIEFIPGVKLIANNFRNGWQPYLAVNMTWMTMEGGSFWADSAVFDRYTIKPFVEYGLGIQKHHGERATGFLQAMVRNGGRTGVALTGGFRWAIGDDIID